MAFPSSEIKKLIQNIKDETLLSPQKIADRIGVTKSAIYNILNERYETVRSHLVESLCVEFDYSYKVEDGIPHFYKSGADSEDQELERDIEEYQDYDQILDKYNINSPDDLEKVLKILMRVFDLEQLNSEIIDNLYSFSSGFLAAKWYRDNS
jgi:transcriptional regulator with XRE-family HTH domain